jgi:MFS family permease
VVFLLALVLFINYVDRGTLSTALPLIIGDLKLDDEQAGRLLSAFFWTYTLMQVPVGWLAERFGGHRVLAIGLVLWAGSTLLTGVVHSFAALMVLRLMLGLGESAGFPCVSKILAVVVPANGLGLANGIVGFAYLFGPAVGTYFGGQLMAHYGWRSAFLVFGAASLLWFIPWSRVAGRVAAVHVSSKADADSPTFRAILKTPAMWGTGLGLFSSNYVFYFMLTWLPTYLMRERGLSTADMATMAGLAFLANAVSALGAGWLIDRHIARGGSKNFAYKSVMAMAHVGSVVCMLCMALGGKDLALASMFVYQVLCGASSPGVYAMSQTLAGPKASGRWVGVQQCMGSFAGVVSPWAAGAIIDHTHRFTNVFLAAAAVSLLGLVGWVWMIPKLQELSWPKKAPAAQAPVALT